MGGGRLLCYTAKERWPRSRSSWFCVHSLFSCLSSTKSVSRAIDNLLIKKSYKDFGIFVEQLPPPPPPLSPPMLLHQSISVKTQPCQKEKKEKRRKGKEFMLITDLMLCQHKLQTKGRVNQMAISSGTYNLWLRLLSNPHVNRGAYTHNLWLRSLSNPYVNKSAYHRCPGA